MRKAAPQSGLLYAIEILNVKNKKDVEDCDFFFMSLPSKRWQEIWFSVLGRFCVVPMAENIHTVPMMDNFQKDVNLIKHKGW